MFLFALTIFTGAFLLFAVQPTIAKYILPWFGGGPGVWTTCMLFFQILLLCGYAYAHGISRTLRPRGQALVHLALLAAAAALLPITPDAGWKPRPTDAPAPRILLLLLVSVGSQVLVLASTGPLIQRWFTLVRPQASPYRLYALSNLGSLLALVSYPFVVEPSLSRGAQASVWSVAFGLFAILSGILAIGILRPAAADVGGDAPAPAIEAGPAPSVTTVALWFCLPACGSALLLAVTNQLCLDVAVIPFLWILPLSLYLLTFILCFESPRWYPRPLFATLLPLGVAGVTLVLHYAADKDISILPQIVVYSSVLFVCCMVCHGELVRLTPHPGRLTLFYLMIAAGGAAGGAFVALLAPLLFRGYFELHVVLLACCALALVVFAVDERWVLHRLRPRGAWGALVLAFAALAAGLGYEARDFTHGALSLTRNFYGVLAVTEQNGKPDMHRYVLSHGSTLHGLQFDHPDKRRWPTSYFADGSGVGLAARYLPTTSPRRIGVVGLGVGTIAAWGTKGDVVRFYEINPEVERIARTRFTYLEDTAAATEVVLGDARISMESEAPQGFDILVLDAFSSDAIPVHLLTREAFEIYLRHLRPDGVIAVHISNAYLDLQPVVFLLADHFHLGKVLVEDYRAEDREAEEAALARDDRMRGLKSSTWVLLSQNAAFLESEEILDASSEPDNEYPGVRLWTDDETNLFRILRE